MCIMDWMIADKESNSTDRKESVVKLIGIIKEVVNKHGYEVIYTVTVNKHLVETYKKLGFQVMENDATTMAFSINNNLDFLKE